MLQFQTYGRPFVRREKIFLFMLQLGVYRKGWRNENRIDLVQLLIKCRPSRNYKDIKLNIEAHSTATASISRPYCPRPLTRREIDFEKDDEASRQICPEMQVDKHYKVSSFRKSHQNTHNSVKYEVI